MTTDHNPLAAVTALVEDAEATDRGQLPVALVRATLDGRYRPDREPEPTPARTPQLGDTVLIRATVIPPERPLAGDMLAVSVPGLSSPVEMEIRTGVVHEVLGPSWWPPQPGDVVLDTRGDMWRWDHDGHEWQEIRGEYAHKKDRLPELFGPLDLIVRGNRRYEP